MNNQDYEQQKRECWDALWDERTTLPISHEPLSQEEIFNYAFDRAYALGKEKETVSQEEIESEANDYAYNIGDSDWERLRVKDAFKDGANFALGKQEKDTEETVIHGWVAKDADDQWVYLYRSMPTRGINMWNGHGSLLMPLDKNLFPNLTWESDPQPVEIIIKRKKNG